jgi:hypothetical protein
MLRSPGSAASDPAPVDRYLASSRRPLAILAFLLPLILAYEAGLAVVLRTTDGVLTNKAHEALLNFFDVFGIAASGGLYFGGAVIVVVLLVWHVLNREPWRVDPAVPGLMALESLVQAIPLILLGLFMANRRPLTGAADLAELDLGAQLAISVGAGLYEELLFRMLLIALIHTLLVDLAGMLHDLGTCIAVGVSAALFAWYHRPDEIAAVVFYVLAGLYFGAVFFWRGFGIVAGAHTCYDVVVVLLMRAAGP